VPLLFWDASALAKRYLVEVGSSTVDAIFTAPRPIEHATTPWGYAEAYSVLLRRHNDGRFDGRTFTVATSTADVPAFLAALQLRGRYQRVESTAARPQSSFASERSCIMTAGNGLPFVHLCRFLCSSVRLPQEVSPWL
jgi:hypothetical protein